MRVVLVWRSLRFLRCTGQHLWPPLSLELEVTVLTRSPQVWQTGCQRTMCAACPCKRRATADAICCLDSPHIVEVGTPDEGDIMGGQLSRISCHMWLGSEQSVCTPTPTNLYELPVHGSLEGVFGTSSRGKIIIWNWITFAGTCCRLTTMTIALH